MLTWGIHFCTDRGQVKGILNDRGSQDLDSAWEQFARMPSTKSIATLVGSCENFFQGALTASRFSKLGVRVFILSVTGCLAQSYLKTRTCPPCGEKFDFDHLLSCPVLGESIYPTLFQACQQCEWESFVEILFLRFHVFLHYYKDGVLGDEENNLFSRVIQKVERT
jgi:hypothetical protein